VQQYFKTLLKLSPGKEIFFFISVLQYPANVAFFIYHLYYWTYNPQAGASNLVVPYEKDIKNYTESSGSFKFLHKDYLGSVLAITDEAGNKLEQRHFDAWGNLTHLKIGANATISDKEQIRNYLSDGNLVVDRGYTSHSLSRPQTGSILRK